MFEGDSGKTKSERSNSISLRSERSNSLSKSSSGYGTLRDQPSETTYDSDEVGFKLNRLWPMFFLYLLDFLCFSSPQMLVYGF